MSTVTTLLNDMLHSKIVDARDVASVLGVSVRSVTRWSGAELTPRKASEERLLELKAVVDALREVMRDEPARLWLRSPVPALSYHKPIDLIQQGEYRHVIGAILALGEGVTG